MKFEEFEAAFIRENRKLKIWFSVTLSVMAIIVLAMFFSRTYFVYQGGEIFKERLLAVDVCKEGFTGIVSGNPSSLFVADEIIKLLKKKPFDVDVTEILVAKSVEEYRCRIVAKTPKGLRSFLVTLAQDNGFDFQYKINQIDETEIKEDQDDVSHSR